MEPVRRRALLLGTRLVSCALFAPLLLTGCSRESPADPGKADEPWNRPDIAPGGMSKGRPKKATR